MERMMMCFLTLLMLLAVCAAFAASEKIYTNKDLEKYTDRKDQEPPVNYTGKKVT